MREPAPESADGRLSCNRGPHAGVREMGVRQGALLALEALSARAAAGEGACSASWIEQLSRMRERALGGRCVKVVGARALWLFDDVAGAWLLWHAHVHASLRGALHLGAVRVHPLDVFGASVNLLHRMLTLAGAGELVVSEWALCEIAPQASQGHAVEALGACYLKHWPVAEPCFRVRCQAVLPPGEQPVKR